MRFPLILLALLLVAPAVGAQVADSTGATPRLVEAQVAPAPPERSQTVAATSLGALGGVAVGTIFVYAVDPPNPLGGDGRTAAVSLTAGLALGAATAASLRRDRSFLRALGGAALGQAAGFGLGFLIDSATGVELGYALAMPAGAVVGAEWSTR